MIRLPARAALFAVTAPAALLAFAPLPLGAQTFSLPPASPTPTPAPAGPADERAGVAIPPRAVPTPSPTASPTPAPIPLPSPVPTSAPTTAPRPVPTASAPAPVRTAPATGTVPAPQTTAAPSPAPAPALDGIAAPGGPADAGNAAQTLPPAPPTLPGTAPEIAPAIAPVADDPAGQGAFGDWWPYAAGGLGLLALLGGGLYWRRRAAPAPRRIAPPPAPARAQALADAAPPRLDLALEIASATRSLMMFTLEYRLVIANRSERAVNDARVAVQLVCARASGGAGPSAGAAQALADAGRIGPHQARTVTGTVQLPLSAIAPLRQGQTPLFIPLAHVTLEGEGLPAQLRSFVIGTRSGSGRVHPISLDVPPGGIPGLVAQAVAVPPPVGAAA